MSLNIQVLSDLHLEFHSGGGTSFIGSLDPTGVDILVMAGDICSARMLPNTIPKICERYRTAECVFVHGNHECYYTSFEKVWAALEELSEVKNLHVLNNRSVTIKGQRIMGTTLWFPMQSMNGLYEDELRDFRAINGFKENVYAENTLAMYYLNNYMQPGDIVVTHHLPCEGSIHPLCKRHSLNRFFLTDMNELILERQPAVWIHGHTHFSCDHVVGSTRVVCNPYGYAGHDINPDWDPSFVVSVGSS